MKAVELTERRAMLLARIQAQRQALGYYAGQIERPARILESAWRWARFLRSPVIAGLAGWLLSRKKQKRRRGRRPRHGWTWFLRQGWQLIAIVKKFGS